MATLKEAIEYAKMNPDTTFATTLRAKIESGEADDRLKEEGISLPGYTPKTSIQEDVISKLSQRGTNIVEEIQRPAEKSEVGRKVLRSAGQIAGGVGDIIGGGVEAVAKGADYLSGGTLSQAGKALLNTDSGQQAIQALQGGGEGYAEWRKNNEDFAKDLEAIVNIATVIPAVKGIGASGKFATQEALAGAKGAYTGTSKAVAPIMTGTMDVAKSIGRGITSVPKSIAINVGELQATEQAIKLLPTKTAQNAVRNGIDKADVIALQNAIKTPEAKTLIETVKNFATGKSKTSPFEVVGKPIVNRLKTLDEQVKNYAAQLDTVAQNLKGQAIDDLTNIQSSVLQGLDRLQIKLADGGLDFAGSSLEGIGNSGKIIENVYKRIEKADDAFALHNLKKYIDANVSYGKRVEGLDAGAERLLKTWRKAIDDTLDTQFKAYNKVNTELAKRISPLEDLKGILKNADGLDTDLLSQKAGIIARRITSAAASNPEIQQVLRNLDKFTSTGGKTLGDVENLQDLYNILNRYYDIAPKTGFQNLVKEGTSLPTGITDTAMQAVKSVAGKTNAVRQKSLENYLDELLKTGKTKK